MNLKQLEYFISVANNLNFTKAAKEHYLSQTAISQQIKNLESTLGFELFSRTRQSVKLTTAGEFFYNEAISIIDKANSAIAKASLVSCGYDGTLTIGFIEGLEKNFLSKIISSFKNKYPNINLNIVCNTMDNLYKDLQAGLIDLVFSFNFNIEKYSNIETKSIKQYPLCTILYNEHPLSSKSFINSSELKGENLIFVDQSVLPFGFDLEITDYINFTIHSNFVYKADSIETVLLMVKSKLGISILPNIGSDPFLNDLVYINLKDKYTDSIISWNTDNNQPYLKQFLNCIDEVANIKI